MEAALQIYELDEGDKSDQVCTVKIHVCSEQIGWYTKPNLIKYALSKLVEILVKIENLLRQ